MKLAWLGVEDMPLFPFVPYPGTELYEALRAEGVLPAMSNEYFARLGYGDLDSAPSLIAARLEPTARVGARRSAWRRSCSWAMRGDPGGSLRTLRALVTERSMTSSSCGWSR